MSHETDIRFSYSAIAEPITTLFWSNRQFIKWGNEAGYASAEFFPFRTTAQEILDMNASVIGTLSEIKSGHVRYNPYATFWSVIIRQEDPLRPGVPFGFYNLAFADPLTSRMALQKLESTIEDFCVVTYPYKVEGRRPYGEYFRKFVQTHPAVFNDTSEPDQMIHQVKSGDYAGVCYDSFHAEEATESGETPLSGIPALIKFLESDIPLEMHVQAGRVKERYSAVDDLSWLVGMTGSSPKYNSELGRRIRLVKEMRPETPFVLEIGLASLIKSRLIKRPKFMHDALREAQKMHSELIDYVKRV